MSSVIAQSSDPSALVSSPPENWRASQLTTGGAGALQGLIVDQLPEWARARQLCELYLEQAPWFFGAITRRQLLDELLPLFYGEALDLQHLGKAPNTPPTQDTADGSPQPTLPVSSSAFACSSTGKASAHELALLGRGLDDDLVQRRFENLDGVGEGLAGAELTLRIPALHAKRDIKTRRQRL